MLPRQLLETLAMMPKLKYLDISRMAVSFNAATVLSAKRAYPQLTLHVTPASDTFEGEEKLLNRKRKAFCLETFSIDLLQVSAALENDSILTMI